MGVTRCVCHDVSFAALIRMARRTGADLDELSRVTGCGTGCGTCLPYIEVALATGRADLPIMPPGALARCAPHVAAGQSATYIPARPGPAPAG
ncbi:MAG: (2Fe-2S)-binding protein [Phycisphaerales bacterium]|nr:(2Fe-2S)-binding protein [Phycisphaerales bacterium]